MLSAPTADTAWCIAASGLCLSRKIIPGCLLSHPVYVFLMRISMCNKGKNTSHTDVRSHFLLIYFRTEQTQAAESRQPSLNHDMGWEHNLLDRLEKYSPNRGLNDNMRLNNFNLSLMSHRIRELRLRMDRSRCMFGCMHCCRKELKHNGLTVLIT